MIEHNELLLDLSELHSKVLQTKVTLETKMSLIKAAIESEKYMIHPQRIIQRMLGEEEEICVCLAAAESSPS